MAISESPDARPEHKRIAEAVHVPPTPAGDDFDADSFVDDIMVAVNKAREDCGLEPYDAPSAEPVKLDASGTSGTGTGSPGGVASAMTTSDVHHPTEVALPPKRKGDPDDDAVAKAEPQVAEEPDAGPSSSKREP